MEAVKALLAARQLVVERLISVEQYGLLTSAVLQPLSQVSACCITPSSPIGSPILSPNVDGVPCQQMDAILSTPPLSISCAPAAGVAVAVHDELRPLIEAEKARLRSNGIIVDPSVNIDCILENMRRAVRGMRIGSPSSSPSFVDTEADTDTDTDRHVRRRVDGSGRGNLQGESSPWSPNVIDFYPDCGQVCCGKASCAHASSIPFYFRQPGDCVTFNSRTPHGSRNLSTIVPFGKVLNVAFLQIQFFVTASEAASTGRGREPFFTPGMVRRDLAERAGERLGAGFFTIFSRFSLRDKKYQGQFLVNSIEFPEKLFDEKSTPAVELERELGSDLYALKLAAEVEFESKHGIAVSTFRMWASWKLPDSDVCAESNGTFEKHLDFPEHPHMFGTIVVGTIARGVAEYQDCEW